MPPPQQPDIMVNCIKTYVFRSLPLVRCIKSQPFQPYIVYVSRAQNYFKMIVCSKATTDAKINMVKTSHTEISSTIYSSINADLFQSHSRDSEIYKESLA